MSAKKSQIDELRTLQAQADEIRQSLSISHAGSILYQSWLNAVDGEMVVVEADGFGHATTSIVEGDYPFDYLTTFSKTFETEEDAENAADAIVRGTYFT